MEMGFAATPRLRGLRRCRIEAKNILSVMAMLCQLDDQASRMARAATLLPVTFVTVVRERAAARLWRNATPQCR